jgi:phage host-nuclease inhibitor protein Gam
MTLLEREFDLCNAVMNRTQDALERRDPREMAELAKDIEQMQKRINTKLDAHRAKLVS